MTDPVGLVAKTGTIESDYETGVSNGDVDWLFRGKSKKLTKKMNSSVTDKEKKSTEQNDDSSRDDKGNDKNVIIDGGYDKVESSNDVESDFDGNHSRKDLYCKRRDSRDSKEGGIQNAETQLRNPVPTPSGNHSTSYGQANAKISSAPSSVEKSSVLEKFKLGRSRSSSASSTHEPNIDPILTSRGVATQESSSSKRRSSFGFSSGGNFNDDLSPSISRSNSTGGRTRSLFSSLSSKFKSNSGSESQTSVSSYQNQQPKLNPNLIGSGLNSISEQDLVSGTSRPPSGMGIKMKNSVSSGKQSKVVNDRANEKLIHSNSRRSSTVSSKPKTKRVVLNKNSQRQETPIKGLENVSLRRVIFAIDQLQEDPQQQIPSRRPKKGNVLIPEEHLAPPPKLNIGITSSDGHSNSNDSPLDNSWTDRKIQMAVESHRKAVIESERHAQEAYVTAKRLACEVSQYKTKGYTFKNTNDEEEDINTLEYEVGAIEIDKPIHTHENHFQDGSQEEDIRGIDDLSLETLYTRCCHLREILPIPATLKQLKNKTKPLHVLKLLNPKPTLIDVLSFSDFIAITPIYTMIFDNVSMSTEMLLHFLGSLKNNNSLEKLSLRNVPIDDEGWKVLCKFLADNKTIKKLDVSQQRIKTDSKPNIIRSNMNWNLFIECLIFRGGVEELVINGCKLSEETFKYLLDTTVRQNTFRLGIAATELTVSKTWMVANWMADPASKCVGVDLAYNDLTKGQLFPLVETFSIGRSKLIFFSLNSTHLSNVDEASELIKSLVNVKTLRFLDMSSLPDLFPSIIPALSKYLPMFESLKRIHFDLNELSAQSIGAIADFLPKMKNLVHVSFLGNRDLSHAAAATLYAAVKFSGSIFNLDLDYDLVDENLSQRIAFYLMKNMGKTLNSEIGSTIHHDDEEEVLYDGSLLMETAEKVLAENDNNRDKQEELKLRKTLANAMMERTRTVRRDIHKIIDSFFEKRNAGTLSLEGKENLLRFCLLDASLEKLVHMFEEQADIRSSDSRVQTNIKNNVNTSQISVANVNDSLHQNSSELISAGHILSPRGTAFNQQGLLNNADSSLQPHQVVVDSSSTGEDVAVDKLTGRPVLMRSISQTSTHAKEQEQEEGELHRWGFFMQQQSNPDSGLNSELPRSKLNKTAPHLTTLPSGSELRDAVVAAKGIESVSELIDKITTDRVSLDKIYHIPQQKKSIERPCGNSANIRKDSVNDDNFIEFSDNESIDSLEFRDSSRNLSEGKSMTAVVDEAYDKLLNDAERVRSSK